MIPAFIDTGSDDGAYAEALLFGSLRLIGPDTFANFTQDAGRECPDSLCPAASVSQPFHSSEVTDG